MTRLDLSRIDRMFDTDGAVDRGTLFGLADKLHASHKAASDKIRRFSVWLLVVWGAAHAIGDGLVEEGTVASLRVTKIQAMLVVAPTAVGVIAYQLTSAVLSVVLLRVALARAYRQLHPSALEGCAIDLANAGSAISVERIIAALGARSGGSPRDAWLQLLTIGLAVGPLVILGHVSYLAWDKSGLPFYVTGASVLLGLLLWIRTVLFWPEIDRLTDKRSI